MTRLDKIMKEYVKESLSAANIAVKKEANRLRWFDILKEESMTTI